MTIRLAKGAAVVACVCASAASATRHDEQLWLQANTHVPLASKLRLTLEQIVRFGDRADGVFQTELGGILGYRLSRNVEVGFGYRSVGVKSGSGTIHEDRIRQHLIVTSGPWYGRFRIDERFHPAGSEVGIRVRPLVRYNHALNTKGLALFASHESFFLPNSTAWGQRRGYERVRNLIGFVVPFSSRLGADIGYLNQYRFARGGAPAAMDHALSVQLTLNLAAPPVPHPDH